MPHGIALAAVAGLLIWKAWAAGGASLALIWPALNCAAVAAACLGAGPGVFGKLPTGQLPVIRSLLLLPFLALTHLVWRLHCLCTRRPAYQAVSADLVVGRRLLSHEFPEDCDNVIDLTAEFSEPAVPRSKNYRLYAILDGGVPSLDQLEAWIEEAVSLPGRTYVHCAQGLGRTALFAAALLLRRDAAATPEQAMDILRTCRPGMRLAAAQAQLLARYAARYQH